MKSGLQKREVPGGQSRNMQLKGGLSPQVK